MAVASRDTNAYFTGAHTGRMGGTLGSSPAECPYSLQPGTSKARHWDLKDCQSARVQPIAQYDSRGTLFLDFGEEVPKNGNASPDVFRLVSLVAEPRAVSFTVSGAMAALVTEVRLRDGTSLLQGGATASVYVKIGVPGDAQPGDYSGTLTVHVDGWSVDPMLPMTITVRGTPPRGHAGGEPNAGAGGYAERGPLGHAQRSSLGRAERRPHDHTLADASRDAGGHTGSPVHACLPSRPGGRFACLGSSKTHCCCSCASR